MSELVDTLASLVRINSVNSFYAGGPGEGEIAAWIVNFFRNRHIEVGEQPVLPGRSNVIARLPGRNRERTVILEAHMDTVSVEGMSIDPFSANIDGGRLYGRGACDTKAGLAGMMCAVAALHAERKIPPCDVWLAAVVDEEFSFSGVAKLCEGLVAHAAIVAEPTNLRAVIASKGVLRWRIVARGRSAHSSKPHLGVNAINHMARVILELEKDHRQLAAVEHPLLGPATCNVGIIHGGVQVNFVPDRCAIEIDRRLLPGESIEGVLAHYQRLLDDLSRQHSTMQFEMEAPMLADYPLSTSADSPPAQLASQILSGMKLNETPCGVPFGSDASKLGRQGIPSLIFGPGSIDQAHAAVEYIDLDQVQRAFEFYREFLLRFE